MVEKKDIVVVIPIYNPNLSDDDKISLNHATQILKDYRLNVICPEGMATDGIRNLYPELVFTEMAAEHFTSLKAYNRLVMSVEFYERFASFEYMLIYQLDALCFKDELLEWANRGYDYVGAPFTPQKERNWAKWKKYFYEAKFALHMNCGRRPHGSDNYKVGNGGFCLRRISKMLEITRKYKEKLAVDLRDELSLYAEDAWMLYELKGKDAMKKPSWKEALRFSVEHRPEKCFALLNEGEFPVGTHNWPLYRDFWEKYL